MNYLVGAFKQPCNIFISFADGRSRNQVPLKKENGKTVMAALFQSQENIVGEVVLEPIHGKKVEHNGVKIELLGQIELYFDRGNFYDFTSLVRELDVPGELYERKAYPFEFATVEMPYESYNGVNVRLRYILKVTVSRNYVSNIVEYQDFVVHNYTPPPSINNSIKQPSGVAFVQRDPTVFVESLHLQKHCRQWGELISIDEGSVNPVCISEFEPCFSPDSVWADSFLMDEAVASPLSLWGSSSVSRQLILRGGVMERNIGEDFMGLRNYAAGVGIIPSEFEDVVEHENVLDQGARESAKVMKNVINIIKRRAISSSKGVEAPQDGDAQQVGSVVDSWMAEIYRG
ncbi:Vacuolar protein sorting-associated protein 26A [Hibiscus syriacus]|uniref:Vacuolar protein sorting-associated protein 26A n=1 Tax=Hibiscus syriacus TaxID=106335 RepID=A0A6A2YXE4_HIBSY|nr:Vacuolar protein sorting-associated protein 26A [Hibiscus syriacus]